MRITQPLKNNYDFRRLYSKGVCHNDAFLAVYCRPNGRKCNRLGITVGKKVGSAVCRNRLRRRLKEAYRLNEGRMKPGFDIVAVGRVRAGQTDYHRLCASFMALLGRHGVMEKEQSGHEESDPLAHQVLPE